MGCCSSDTSKTQDPKGNQNSNNGRQLVPVVQDDIPAIVIVPGSPQPADLPRDSSGNIIIKQPTDQQQPLDSNNNTENNKKDDDDDDNDEETRGKIAAKKHAQMEAKAASKEATPRSSADRFKRKNLAYLNIRAPLDPNAYKPPTATEYKFALASSSTTLQLPHIEGGAEAASVFACFQGGMLYRLTGPVATAGGDDEDIKKNKKKKNKNSEVDDEVTARHRATAWYFYNDTSDLNMLVSYSFGPASKVRFGPAVAVAIDDACAGWTDTEALIAPGECCLFMEGVPNGYRSNFESVAVGSPVTRKLKMQQQSQFDTNNDNDNKQTQQPDDEPSDLVHEATTPINDEEPASPSLLLGGGGDDDEDEEADFGASNKKGKDLQIQMSLHVSQSQSFGGGGGGPAGLAGSLTSLGGGAGGTPNRPGVADGASPLGSSKTNSPLDFSRSGNYVRKPALQFLAENKRGIVSEMEQLQHYMEEDEGLAPGVSPARQRLAKFRNEEEFCLLESVGRRRGRNNNNIASPTSATPARGGGGAAAEAAAGGEDDEATTTMTTQEPFEFESVRRACRKHKMKFVDMRFPPTDESLFRPDQDDITVPSMSWARVAPPAIQNNNSNKQLDASDIESGSLGDSWVSNGLAAIADRYPHLVRQRLFGNLVKVLDCDGEEQQQQQPDDDDGIIYVTINKAGWWRTLVLDDYLPVTLQRPAFARSRAANGDTWVSFAQKALAKAHGSYAALVGGEAIHSLQDFSGFPTMSLIEQWSELQANNNQPAAASEDQQLFDRLARNVNVDKHLCVFSTPSVEDDAAMAMHNVNSFEDFADVFANVGLVLGAAYPVRKVYSGAGVKLLQFRNTSSSSPPLVPPLEDGDAASSSSYNAASWNGAWSFGSVQWAKNAPAELAGLRDEAEERTGAVFWMSWEDCKKHFADVGLCYCGAGGNGNQSGGGGGGLFEYRVLGFWDNMSAKQEAKLKQQQDEANKRSKKNKQQESDSTSKTTIRPPSVILEVTPCSDPTAESNSNIKTLEITAMLSQSDARGLRSDHPAAHGAAMVLSAFDNDPDEEGWFRLLGNSTQDIETTSTAFPFAYLRDVSMKVRVDKAELQRQPLYLVPRSHELSKQVKTFYSVSLFCSEPVNVRFRRVEDCVGCPVFSNAKAVSHKEWCSALQPTEARFQVRSPGQLQVVEGFGAEAVNRVSRC